MAVAYRCVFQDDALVVRSLFESAGISCELIPDSRFDVNPMFDSSVAGFRIEVAESELEDALALAEDYKARKQAARDADGGEGTA
ncbi:MAG: hypothetical protein JXA15_03510 [Spirochaetales bacterium]|nr:hypothetical protein [Spirochaetales bacterium]